MSISRVPNDIAALFLLTLVSVIFVANISNEQRKITLIFLSTVNKGDLLDSYEVLGKVHL